MDKNENPATPPSPENPGTPLPSPDELMAKRDEIVKSATLKLKELGFTHDEALILTGSYFLFS
jgi:hypothetical protein